MVRMIVISDGIGLVFALVFGFAGNSSAVQVTFFGSGMPTPDPSNFSGTAAGDVRQQACQ